ncbi:MAG: class I SAM-dependent methyltransferase [Rubrivivax sp.]
MTQPLSLPRPAAPDPQRTWRELLDRSSAPYRQAGRFAWYFARGKLSRDPVFRGLLERGDLGWPGRSVRVVDIGCGQGLMASLLQVCADLDAQGRWPLAWAPAPRAAAYTGIELMARDVHRAERAVGTLPLAPRFVCADMRQADIPDCDLVVILDVLHYVDHDAQAALLARVRRALGARGRLVLRVGDMAQARGYAASQWVDRVVTAVRGHRVPPTWGRSVAQWTALLQGLGFAVQTVPMSRGTPFANVMLVGDT